MNRFTILKSSWGIAIFYEIKELFDVGKDSINTYEIFPSVYLKLNDNPVDNISLDYLKAGVVSIIQYIKTFPVIFFIEKLEYNICDYQPEGMYYMFRQWFFEHHGIEFPPINVYYNKKINQYIFPDLKSNLSTL